VSSQKWAAERDGPNYFITKSDCLVAFGVCIVVLETIEAYFVAITDCQRDLSRNLEILSCG